MGGSNARVANEVQLLQELAVVVAAAGITAVLFQRLRIPVLFGYVTVGVLIGPHGPFPQLVRDESSLQTLADLGVVLLLFSLGLTFNLRQLRRVGGVALVVMVSQGVLMFWLGHELGRWIGWSTVDNLFLGAMLSISSTTIAVKVLRDASHDPEGPSAISFGVLILQDVAAVLILVLLAGYSQEGTFELAAAGRTLALMVVFLLATILLGLILVPRFVDYVAHRHGDETLTLAVVGLGLGFATISAFIGLHVGLGAFVMGALIAEAKRHLHIASLLRPITDLFTALFFVSMGTLVNLELVVLYWKPIVAIAALVLFGKFVAGAIATLLSGYSTATSVAVGIGLAQVGEFSFIIAGLGQTTGLTSDFLFPVVVGASALTALAVPIAWRNTEWVHRFLARASPASLRTFVRAYVSWMGSVRSRPNPGRRARRLQARRSVMLAGVILTSIMVAAYLLRDIGPAILTFENYREPAPTLTYWGLVVALVVPFLFRFYIGLNHWVETWELPEGATRRVGARHFVKYPLYLLGVIIVGLPIVAVSTFLVRNPLILPIWIVLVASLAVILWASIQRLHDRIEENVQTLLDDQHVPLRAPQVVRDLLTLDVPWDLKLDTVDIETEAWVTGRRLRDVDLRGSTGASLILVERDHSRQESPGPETMLLPGDRVTLIGSTQQVAAARMLLRKRTDPGSATPQMRLGRLFVSPGSRLDGVELKDAELPTQHGLQVAAVVRGGNVIANPGKSERLRAGDLLLVLGAQQRITEAGTLVQERHGAHEAAPSDA